VTGFGGGRLDLDQIRHRPTPLRPRR